MRGLLLALLLTLTGCLPGLVAPAPPPGFAGTYLAHDPTDGSLVTLSLVQQGEQLQGTYADAASGALTPGFAGPLAGALTGPQQALVQLDLVRGADSATLSATSTLILSRDGLLLTSTIQASTIRLNGQPVVTDDITEFFVRTR